MADDLAKSTPKRVNVLAVHRDDLKTMTLESLGHVVALEVLRRVTSDGHIVVVDDNLDVEALRYG